MIELQFNMKDVKAACKGLAGDAARRAVPADGTDAKPVRLSYIGSDPNPGMMPIWADKPKFKIIWEVEEGDAGDFTGRVFWKLLGYKGYFPAVTDYVGAVPARAHATFFPTKQKAETCAATCADILRKQFVAMFHQEVINAGPRQS